MTCAPEESGGTIGGSGQVGEPERRGDPEKPIRRILLIEDDNGIRSVLRAILEEQGYLVDTAENGSRGLEMLRSALAPDLIVLDLRLPIMDGWEFRTIQKSDPAIGGIPVLAISADGSAQAAAIDAQQYLRKPFSGDQFLAAINQVLADAERRSLLGRLEEAERLASIGRLAARIGHEVNNPLAYIAMNVDLVLRQLDEFSVRRSTGVAYVEDVESLRGLLGECLAGVSQIRDVVGDLQRLSQESQGGGTAFSLNEVLDEALGIVRRQLEHRGQVRKQYGQLPVIVGHRSAMVRAIVNLLLNAASALPEGRTERNEVTLRSFARGEQVIVEVRDTGAGIPPEVLPHLFDPFSRQGPTRGETHLGLVMCSRIVEDHGGRIDVETSVGVGSIFRCTLPAAPVAASVTTVREPRRTRARILIIDDMPFIGQAIAAVLSEHDVTVVRWPAQALARFVAGETFDVILFDLSLPERAASDVMESLRTEWPHLAANVVFMAEGPLTLEQTELLNRSPQRRLLKPFSVGELRAAIEAHLNERDLGRN